MIDQTLKAIAGDSKPEVRLTWEDILSLLNCDSCHFRDEQEEKLCFDFIFSLIESRGEQWVSENTHNVINEWETLKEQHRNQKRTEQQKNKDKRKEKRKSGLLGKLFKKKKQ